jgi:hypothetical protein
MNLNKIRKSHILLKKLPENVQIRIQSRCKVFPLEPYFEVTRKVLNSEGIFDLLNLLNKFHPKIITLSASDPGVK